MEVIDWSPDWGNSISSATGRLVVDGVRAAEVRPEASSKGQIAALMDLLDLHYAGVDAGSSVVPDRLMLRIPSPTSEARGAIGTLLQALAEPSPPAVTVLERVDGEEWLPVELGWDLSDDTEYPGWESLLAQPRPVPALVSDTVQRVDSRSLRAYPMLSTKDRWSLRVEGLEVARVREESMTLGVGKDGKLGGQSLQRKAWIEATGLVDPVTTGDADDASQAISSLHRPLAAARGGQSGSGRACAGVEDPARSLPGPHRRQAADAAQGRCRGELGQPVPHQVGPRWPGPLPRCAPPRWCDALGDRDEGPRSWRGRSVLQACRSASRAVPGVHPRGCAAARLVHRPWPERASLPGGRGRAGTTGDPGPMARTPHPALQGLPSRPRGSGP